MADVDIWAEAARAAVLDVLAEHHAVVHPELEARIAEANFSGASGNLDPHHVTNALRELRDAGAIEWVNGSTRGGRDVQTIQPTDRRRRATKIDTAAARKRLLLARYNGWSQGT